MERAPIQTRCQIRWQEQVATVISELGKKAMLEEVYTTPKPGLVDCYSNGAHTDMNLHTFRISAEAITPYLFEMAMAGILADQIKAEIFLQIREIGKRAEEAMFTATEGVNTHKGMIFSMGIFATIAGYCVGHGWILTEPTLFFLEQKLVKKTLEDELALLKGDDAFDSNYQNPRNEVLQEKTHGASVYQSTGITGIRGEAISGYESVRKLALPVFREGMKQKRDYNRVKLQTLFTLMSKVQDSNVVARRGKGAIHMVQDCTATFLRVGGAYQEHAFQLAIQLDDFFIKENISCGGCADLLAITIFIYELLHHEF